MFHLDKQFPVSQKIEKSQSVKTLSAKLIIFDSNLKKDKDKWFYGAL